jgi:hypothetical protein
VLLLIKNIILGFYLVGVLAAQTEVMILSQKVGTEIDMHENRFYRIFPKEKGFINAQVIRINKENFRVVIIKKVRGKERLVKRFISLDDYEKLQLHVDAQSELTEKAKLEMYEGMDFLRAEKIVNDIPKPQYVILKHSGQKKWGGRLKGSLFYVDENMLHIQTPTTIEKVHLSDLDQLSYRPEIGDYEHLRPYLYGITGLAGLALAQVYNSQRNFAGVDANGDKTISMEEHVRFLMRPRNDLDRYTHLFGIVIGLIFSSELFDAVSTLLTPSETIILSEAEYEKKNIK